MLVELRDGAAEAQRFAQWCERWRGERGYAAVLVALLGSAA